MSAQTKYGPTNQRTGQTKAVVVRSVTNAFAIQGFKMNEIVEMIPKTVPTNEFVQLIRR